MFRGGGLRLGVWRREGGGLRVWGRGEVGIEMRLLALWRVFLGRSMWTEWFCRW